MQSLPIELNEKIIEQLEDNNAALRACSLTCHSWLRPTRELLYHHVELVTSAAIICFQKAFGTLLPSLSDPLRYCRQFVIVVQKRCTVFSLPQATLLRLVGVTTLCIHNRGFVFIEESDGREPLLLPANYCPNVERPQFGDVAEKFQDDFLQLITGFNPRLSAVEIKPPFPPDAIGLPATTCHALRLPLFTLRELTLLTSSPYAASVVDCVVRRVFRSRIEVLELQGQNCVWDIGALLTVVAPTLRALRINLFNGLPDTCFSETLVSLCLSPLEHLSIAFTPDHFDSVSTILTSTPLARLRCITVIIDCFLDTLESFGNWPELDAHLARLGTGVPKLKLKIGMPRLRFDRNASPRLLEPFRQRALAQLPQSVAQGMVITVVSPPIAKAPTFGIFDLF